MGRWLFKEEPTHYSYSQLAKDGRTVWDGVRNNLALKHLRNVKKGDQAFYYHTDEEKTVFGIMRIVSDPYADPKSNDPRHIVVDVEPSARLSRPVPLNEIKKNPKLKGIELARLPRLSVMPIMEDVWDEILALSKNRV